MKTFTLCFMLFMITGIPIRLSAQCLPSAPTGAASFANNTTVGSFAWSSVGNAAASDNQYASASKFIGVLSSATSNYIQITNFGLSIPLTATICQIVVEVERSGSGIIVGSSIKDNSVRIIKNGVITGNEEANSSAWTGTDTYIAYGTSVAEATWGITTWTPADLNASNFGVAISVTLNAGLAGVLLGANIDYVRVTVYFDTNILAISLYDFSVTENNGINTLQWKAASNNEQDAFVVERSSDMKDWHAISSLPVTINESQYQYADHEPLNGINYYRLKMQNADGSIAYSPIKTATVNNTDESITIYPNPSSSMITIRNNKQSIQHIFVKDIQGRLVQSIVPASQSGNVQLAVGSWKPGLYFLQVDDQTLKFLKQ